jgi:hypothetical protein
MNFYRRRKKMSINSILEKRNKFQQAVETTSNFDFKFYGIEDETTRNELLQKEEIAKRNIMQIQRNTIELGKILYETQELLANNKNGAFNGWFLNLGLKKDFVYREIQRYKIFLKYHNEKIKELSIRTIKYISTNEMPEEQVIEIIEAEEPSKKIDEIEKNLKQEVTLEEKIKNLENKIIQARKNIAKWEQEIEKLRS